MTKREEDKAVFVIVASALFAATHGADADDKTVAQAAIKRAKALADQLDEEFEHIDRPEEDK